jgi:hypothetical protein
VSAPRLLITTAAIAALLVAADPAGARPTPGKVRTQLASATTAVGYHVVHGLPGTTGSVKTIAQLKDCPRVRLGWYACRVRVSYRIPQRRGHCHATVLASRRAWQIPASNCPGVAQPPRR